MMLRLSSKGQLVLPKKIREELHLKSGGQFQAHIADGLIILEPVQPGLVDQLYGRFAGIDLLKDLEEEHRREVEND